MKCKLLWQSNYLIEVVRRLRIILIFYKGRNVNGICFVKCMEVLHSVQSGTTRKSVLDKR